MATLTKPIANGFRAVGDSIEQNIIQKLNMGNTLLGTFLNEVLRGFIAIGANYLTGGLAGLAGVGGGGSGLMSGGDIGSSLVGRYGQAGGGVGIGRITVVPIINNAGLAVKVYQGGKVNNKLFR